eukprot:scaffold102325_cov48-Phaeocystis_antarctica.AAC.1
MSLSWALVATQGHELGSSHQLKCQLKIRFMTGLARALSSRPKLTPASPTPGGSRRKGSAGL